MTEDDRKTEVVPKRYNNDAKSSQGGYRGNTGERVNDVIARSIRPRQWHRLPSSSSNVAEEKGGSADGESKKVSFRDENGKRERGRRKIERKFIERASKTVINIPRQKINERWYFITHLIMDVMWDAHTSLVRYIRETGDCFIRNIFSFIRKHVITAVESFKSSTRALRTKFRTYFYSQKPFPTSHGQRIVHFSGESVHWYTTATTHSRAFSRKSISFKSTFVCRRR